jgi:hypothetical protein
MIKDFIEFRKQKVPLNKKTDIWSVFSKYTDDCLGEVKWHPQWRHYCFFPELDTVFSDRCLETLSDFVNVQNEKHRRGLK